MNVNEQTLEALKQAIKSKQDVVGQTFINKLGARGKVLPDKSAHGKLQAEMTCTVEGCKGTYIRESSDWHQAYKCGGHTKAPADKEAEAALKKEATGDKVAIQKAYKAKLSEVTESMKMQLKEVRKSRKNNETPKAGWGYDHVNS